MDLSIENLGVVVILSFEGARIKNFNDFFFHDLILTPRGFPRGMKKRRVYSPISESSEPIESSPISSSGSGAGVGAGVAFGLAFLFAFFGGAFLFF